MTSDNGIFDTECKITMLNEIYQKLENMSRNYETIKKDQPYLNNI